MTIVLQRFDETDTTEKAGGFGALECEYGNLPLKQLCYHANVVGLGIRSSILQTFYNPYDQPIEAVYIFPIEGGQAVVGCEMRVGERVVRARLKERSQARADYQQAIRSGHRAALLEENRSETFSMRVGNIPAGEAIIVKIETIAQMSVAYGEWTLRIPLVVAPRYTSGIALPGPSVGTGAQEDTDQVPDASSVTPPTWLPGFASPIDLRLSVELQMGELATPNWIGDLKSSLHAVALDRESDQSVAGKCKLQIFPGERVNRDFILRGKIDDSQMRTAACIEIDPAINSRATFAIHIVPPRVDTRVPRDVVFLLDHSGSMGGWKMTAARRGIARLVDSLLPADRFQVLAFDDSIKAFQHGTFKSSKNGDWLAATDVNRFEAVRWLGNINAAGGTEMGMAIEYALNAFTHDDNLDSARSPAIVLVTDGQITGEDSVLRLIGSIPTANRPRIYCLGIDRAVNASVLKRLTDFTGGTFELVESENRLNEVLQRFGGEIGAPAVRDLRVDPDSPASIDLAPAKPLTLYTGKSLTIYGRLSSDIQSVTLLGKLPDGSAWDQTIDLVPSQNHEPVLLPLWAKVHVRELEDEFVASGSRDSAFSQKIIECSTQCNVLSRLTAFIAVDETEMVTTGEKLHSITQLTDFPEGWELPQPKLNSSSLIPVGTRSPSAGATDDRALDYLEDNLADPASITRAFSLGAAASYAAAPLPPEADMAYPMSPSSADYALPSSPPVPSQRLSQSFEKQLPDGEPMRSASSFFSRRLHRSVGNGIITRLREWFAGLTFGGSGDSSQPSSSSNQKSFESIIRQALALHASHVMASPSANGVQITFVVDGQAFESGVISSSAFKQLMSHLRQLTMTSIVIRGSLQSSFIRPTVDHQAIQIELHLDSDAVLMEFPGVQLSSNMPEAVTDWWETHGGIKV